METLPEKFDPSKLMEGVRDRIKATFVSLIPDDQWDAMVKAESEKFFQSRIDPNDYHRQKRIPSQFEELVLEMMREKCKEVIKEFLNDPKYGITSQYKWNETTQTSSNEVTMSDLLENMIKEKMPDLMLLMFTNVLKGGFYQLFQELRNSQQLR